MAGGGWGFCSFLFMFESEGEASVTLPLAALTLGTVFYVTAFIFFSCENGNLASVRNRILIDF